MNDREKTLNTHMLLDTDVPNIARPLISSWDQMSTEFEVQINVDSRRYTTLTI